jgi:N-acetyl-anhydromuramyl-L-alanine amidase AmpD
MRELDLIIIHCSASPNGRHHTVADIDRWHKERGFSGIGYHYVIYTDGTAHIGRSIECVGAHCAGYNARSVGICLIGTDKFSTKQWDRLKTLVEKLQEQYTIYRVAGHNEIPRVAKACPGFSVKAWRENEKKALGGYINEIVHA